MYEIIATRKDDGKTVLICTADSPQERDAILAEEVRDLEMRRYVKDIRAVRCGAQKMCNM